MKNTLFRLIAAVLLITGFAITITSCEQNDVENIVEEATTENTQLDFRKPEIRANVASGFCCTDSSGPVISINPNKRNVEITLNSDTYNSFCTNGNSLTYKFYRYNNPTLPIVKTSNSFSPTFCLPATDMALLICSGGGCGLSYNGSGFSVIPNTGTSSSTIYGLTPNTCARFPHEG